MELWSKPTNSPISWTASSDSDDTDGTSTSTGLSGGAIAGIVIGVLALVIIIALAAFCVHKKSQEKKAKEVHAVAYAAEQEGLVE